MKIRMMDGVRQHRKYPETFSIPDRTAKVAVQVGDYVKLSFINTSRDPDQVGGERMWVMVKKIDGRKYSGVLHNEPISFQKRALKYGDKIEFESRHILDIIRR